jgi:hypothetical protein
VFDSYKSQKVGPALDHGCLGGVTQGTLGAMSSWSETLTDEIMIASRTAFDRFDHENTGTNNVEVSLQQVTPSVFSRTAQGSVLSSHIISGTLSAISPQKDAALGLPDRRFPPLLSRTWLLRSPRPGGTSQRLRSAPERSLP